MRRAKISGLGREQLFWSLDALSAGFVLGYAIGYARNFSTEKAGNSEVA
jgi:hypothetical protein